MISISNWWKIRQLSSKSLSWWYIHAHPESCKIIHQVNVQTLVYVCISITSCKNKIIHFRGSDIDIKVHCTLFPLCSIFFVPLGFFWLKVFNEAVEAHPIRFHNYGSSKGECYGILYVDLPYILCTYWIRNILINTKIYNINY